MSRSGSAKALDAGSLRRACDPRALGFASTAEVKPIEASLRQRRATEAVAFGLEMRTAGYNLFATGPVGTGKRSSLEAQLRDYAGSRPAPDDWVYLHNFHDARRPIAVALPSGRGSELAADMRRFLTDAGRELAAAFEGESYARRQHEATEPLEREQEAALADLREGARREGIAIELSPAGVVTMPLRGAHPLTPQEFAELPDTVRARYQTAIEQLAPRMQTFVAGMRARQREGQERLRALEREVALFAIGHLIDELKQRHAQTPRLIEWLGDVAEDVIGNLPAFQQRADQALSRYEVNVFVAHDPGAGAPVVLESNPSFPNLFGRIEHRGMLGGGLETDHRMLRSGAIHRANGGYLMLPAAEVLSTPLVWLKLKNVLRTGSVRLENPAETYALIPTATLSPEQIPLDIKIVLVGNPALYELAYRLDEDVRKLFRVKVEFDWRMRWNRAGERAYAAFLSAQTSSCSLLHFDAGAVARIVEHGARLAENRDWLSTAYTEIAGLAAESSHWAASEGSATVGAAHVTTAIARKTGRSNLIEQRLLEMVAEGTLLLNLSGERVGQVNGLSVLQLGDYSFGRPMRITASAGPGRGALVSIEREAELSGQIHDKGFLTLSGYLRERFGGESRIALSATLTFEQSYEHIDGDSAASAELYALLSAIAGVPLRQDIAVTGSVNQHGEVQAIGGVNEKIEGFFHACRLAPLTGTQGVMIPAANVRHLMLSDEVVQAVRDGRFHVWSVRTIEQGIELLSGIPAGRRRKAGTYTPGSVHDLVQRRLERWAHVGEPAPPGDRSG